VFEPTNPVRDAFMICMEKTESLKHEHDLQPSMLPGSYRPPSSPYETGGPLALQARDTELALMQTM